MQQTTKQVKFWKDVNPDLELFNSLDQEYISTSAPPCLVRLQLKKGTTGSSYYEDDVYGENPIKVFDAPIEICGSFSPAFDVFQLTFMGGDIPKEASIFFNKKEWDSTFRRPPHPGDLIRTPEYKFIYRADHIQPIDPVFFGDPMHYQINGILEESLDLENFDYEFNNLIRI